jgi:AraC family transcriptional regulator
MKIEGRGRILFWEGASLWTFAVLPAPDAAPSTTDFHAHHAIQVTLSLGGRMNLRTAAHDVAGDAIVAADEAHIFEAQGKVALLFVEPESAAGRAIAKSHLRDASLSALPGPLVADLVAQLRAASDAVNESALETLGRAIVRRLAGGEGAALLDPRVRTVIDHAAAHLDRPVSLATAAKSVGLSPSRFRHLFVEQTGLGFRTYLLWLRIMKAVGLYSNGGSLTEAAHEAGFADSAHFSRTFRRMFGLPAASLRIV